MEVEEQPKPKLAVPADPAIRPSALMRPELTKVTKKMGEPEQNMPDMVRWRAAYGDFDAFGISPAEAMDYFDELWYTKLTD